MRVCVKHARAQQLRLLDPHVGSLSQSCSFEKHIFSLLKLKTDMHWLSLKNINDDNHSYPKGHQICM